MKVQAWWVPRLCFCIFSSAGKLRCKWNSSISVPVTRGFGASCYFTTVVLSVQRGGTLPCKDARRVADCWPNGQGALVICRPLVPKALLDLDSSAKISSTSFPQPGIIALQRKICSPWDTSFQPAMSQSLCLLLSSWLTVWEIGD